MKSRNDICRHNLMPIFLLFLLIFCGYIRANTPDLCSQNNIRLDILPGNGWDNLKNTDEGQVIDVSAYRQCKLNTGSKFLVPDFVFMIPKRETTSLTASQVVTDVTKLTSTTSRSINAELVGTYVVTLSAKYSKTYRDTVQQMFENKQVLNRAEIRYLLYTIELQPSAPLHPLFKSQLLNIAQFLQNGDEEMAKYLSELLIRNYGTHYITSIDAGALVERDDMIATKGKSVHQETINDWKVGISLGWSLFLKIGTEFKGGKNLDKVNNYKKVDKTEKIKTVGGPLIEPGQFAEQNTKGSFLDWAKQVDDLGKLAIIDRRGDPIYLLINHDYLPELPFQLVDQVYSLVKSASERYYRYNTHKGCTKADSEYFSLAANVLDEKLCTKAQDKKFLFGGVYVQCSFVTGDGPNICSRYLQKNTLSGGYSCPDGYKEVRLYEHVKESKQGYQQCVEYGKIYKKRCRREETRYRTSKVRYTMVWCEKQGQAASKEYRFGGFFSKTRPHPLTKARKCPDAFNPVKFGESATLCVSPETGNSVVTKNQIPIAGFYSCSVKNPYAPGGQTCPDGYGPQVLSIEQGSCDISFCRLNNPQRDRFPDLVQPPFEGLPHIAPDVERSRNTQVFIGLGCSAFIKNVMTGQWVPENEVKRDMPDLWEDMKDWVDAEKEDKCVLDPGEGSNATEESTIVMAVALPLALLLLVLLVLVIFLFRRNQQRKQRSQKNHNHGDRADSENPRYVSGSDNHAMSPSTSRTSGGSDVRSRPSAAVSLSDRPTPPRPDKSSTLSQPSYNQQHPQSYN